jgi:predicted nucleic acid-binding protein
MLRAFDELVPKIPARPAAEVASQLEEVRRARRAVRRLTPAEHAGCNRPRSSWTLLLIDSLTGAKNSAPFLRAWIDRGERILLPSLVLYEWLRRLRRARGREIDLAIAATAIIRNASLWTLNTADVQDIPNLQLLPITPHA